jgi:hypothetical protein
MTNPTQGSFKTILRANNITEEGIKPHISKSSFPVRTVPVPPFGSDNILRDRVCPMTDQLKKDLNKGDMYPGCRKILQAPAI